MAGDSLAERFLALVEPGRRERVATPDLGERLAAIVVAAETEWPTVRQPEDQYLAHLAGKIGDIDLDDLMTSDLYLASACAAGDAEAIAAFCRANDADLAAALRHIGATQTVVEDIRQRVLDMLFVDEGGTRQIADYAGRGQLRSWVRSIAVRQAMRTMGRERKEGARAGELGAGMPDTDDDPELLHLKRLYGAEFAVSFQDAIAALEPRERNLLRQHHLQSLTAGELGALYRVHKATAARWVAAARQHLFEETRRRLIARLALGDTDVDSIIRLVQSQIDVSIERYLRDD